MVAVNGFHIVAEIVRLYSRYVEYSQYGIGYIPQYCLPSKYCSTPGQLLH